MVQPWDWHIANSVLGNRISTLIIVLEQIHQYLLMALKRKQLKVCLNSDLQSLIIKNGKSPTLLMVVISEVITVKCLPQYPPLNRIINK